MVRPRIHSVVPHARRHHTYLSRPESGPIDVGAAARALPRDVRHRLRIHQAALVESYGHSCRDLGSGPSMDALPDWLPYPRRRGAPLPRLGLRRWSGLPRPSREGPAESTPADRVLPGHLTWWRARWRIRRPRRAEGLHLDRGVAPRGDRPCDPSSHTGRTIGHGRDVALGWNRSAGQGVRARRSAPRCRGVSRAWRSLACRGRRGGLSPVVRSRRTTTPSDGDERCADDRRALLVPDPGGFLPGAHLLRELPD